MIDPAAADALIAHFADSIVYTTNRERRVAMSSPLYDLQGRSSYGFAAVYEVTPKLVRQLEAAMPAERIGERMGAPLMRPYFLQLFILFYSYLMGREQRLVDAGGRATAAEAEEVLEVCDWFRRACAAYRTDGELFPDRTVVGQPILPPAQLEQWAQGEPLEEDLTSRVQRAFGRLEVYALTVHGEQRDGNFDHGPYPAAGGGRLVFHEVDDLDNDYLPWVDEGRRLGVDAVGVVRSYAGPAKFNFDVFGTSDVDPPSAPFRPIRLLAREGGDLREIEVEELEELAAAAGRATGELYAKIAAWEPDYRTAYGGPLFLNHLQPFARLAGSAAGEEWLREMRDVAGARDRELLAGPAAKELWSRLAAGGEVFSPIEPASRG